MVMVASTHDPRNMRFTLLSAVHRGSNMEGPILGASSVVVSSSRLCKAPSSKFPFDKPEVLYSKKEAPTTSNIKQVLKLFSIGTPLSNGLHTQRLRT